MNRYSDIRGGRATAKKQIGVAYQFPQLADPWKGVPSQTTNV